MQLIIYSILISTCSIFSFGSNKITMHKMCKNYIKNYVPIEGEDEFGQYSLSFPPVPKRIKENLEKDTVEFIYLKYSLMLYQLHCESIRDNKNIDYMLFTKKKFKQIPS